MTLVHSRVYFVFDTVFGVMVNFLGLVPGLAPRTLSGLAIFASNLAILLPLGGHCLKTSINSIWSAAIHTPALPSTGCSFP